MGVHRGLSGGVRLAIAGAQRTCSPCSSSPGSTRRSTSSRRSTRVSAGCARARRRRVDVPGGPPTCALAAPGRRRCCPPRPAVRPGRVPSRGRSAGPSKRPRPRPESSGPAPAASNPGANACCTAPAAPAAGGGQTSNAGAPAQSNGASPARAPPRRARAPHPYTDLARKRAQRPTRARRTDRRARTAPRQRIRRRPVNSSGGSRRVNLPRRRASEPVPVEPRQPPVVTHTAASGSRYTEWISHPGNRRGTGAHRGDGQRVRVERSVHSTGGRGARQPARAARRPTAAAEPLRQVVLPGPPRRCTRPRSRCSRQAPRRRPPTTPSRAGAGCRQTRCPRRARARIHARENRHEDHRRGPRADPHRDRRARGPRPRARGQLPGSRR